MTTTRIAASFRENASLVSWRVRVLDATSPEERRAVMARVAPEELHELLEETADPALVETLHAHFGDRGRG